MASLNYLREMLTMLSEEIRVQQTSLTSSSTWEASTWSSSKSVGSKVIVGLKRYFCCWRKSLTQKQSNTMWKWIPTATLCCWMLIYLELFHKFLFMTKHMLLWYHFCKKFQINQQVTSFGAHRASVINCAKLICSYASQLRTWQLLLGLTDVIFDSLKLQFRERSGLAWVLSL